MSRPMEGEHWSFRNNYLVRSLETKAVNKNKQNTESSFTASPVTFEWLIAFILRYSRYFYDSLGDCRW